MTFCHDMYRGSVMTVYYMYYDRGVMYCQCISVQRFCNDNVSQYRGNVMTMCHDTDLIVITMCHDTEVIVMTTCYDTEVV